MALIPRGSRRVAAGGLYSDVGSRGTSFALEINTRVLDRLGEDVALRVRHVIAKATFDIQAQTQQTIRDKDLIDTGNLLNSITAMLTDDGRTGFVDVGAYYGIYLEFGTVRMSPKPFLGPAVEQITPSFIRAIQAVVREARNR